MSRRLLYIILFVAMIIFSLSFGGKVDTFSTEILSTEHVGEITKGREITQTIIPEKDASEIGLLCATYRRTNKCILKIELYDGIVRLENWDINCNQLEDNNYIWLKLEKARLIEKHEYLLSISSDGSKGNAITIYKNSTGEHDGLRINDTTASGESLCYKIKYSCFLPVNKNNVIFVSIITFIAINMVVSLHKIIKETEHQRNPSICFIDKNSKIENKRLLHRSSNFMYVSVGIGAFCIICLVVVMAAKKPEQVDIRKIEDFSYCNTHNILFNIESYEDIGKGVIIQGWVVEPEAICNVYNYGMDKNIEGTYDNIHVALKTKDNLYILPTNLIKRNDINQAIDKAGKYGKCGFISFLPNSTKEIAANSEIMLLKRSASSETLYNLGLTWEQTGGNYDE